LREPPLVDIVDKMESLAPLDLYKNSICYGFISTKIRKKAGKKYENNIFKYKVHNQIVDLNYASTKYLNI